MNRDDAGQARPRLWVGLLALLPILGADQAEVAVREGNALYRSGQYEAALRQYDAAAKELPDSSVIEFNRGDALFKSRDQDQERALDRYLAALATDDPALASRAKYNIGVIKYRQALAAAQRYEDALTLAQAAIGYFRDSLRLDGGYADARYNLELAYRFHHRLEQELLQAQRNAKTPEEKTSLRRGQAFSDKITNEGSGQRDARPDLHQRSQGQANDVPENFSNNEETSKPPQMARLPVAMSPDGARQLMEQLRQRLEKAEIRRLEQRRQRLQQADEPTPW